MATNLSTIVEQLRSFDPERALGLRPSYPSVAVELEGRDVVLVRLKRRRRGKAGIEGQQVRTLAGPAVPLSIFDSSPGDADGLRRALAELFEATGTRPGRVSLILPDNLAKISLLHLPERPPTRRQLEQIVRFKMRRAVPFKLDEAVLSYQELAGQGPGVSLLVALMRRSLVERYEDLLGSLGARPGLVDLCTPNLLNLCRERLEADGAGEGDGALLNVTRQYFSLVIVRRSQLIFFRCKSFAQSGDEAGPENGLLTREMASSLSYYQEKLSGERIRSLYVRSSGVAVEEVAARIADDVIERVVPLDPLAGLTVEGMGELEPALAQRIAPALGAAVGRG